MENFMKSDLEDFYIQNKLDKQKKRSLRNGYLITTIIVGVILIWQLI